MVTEQSDSNSERRAVRLKLALLWTAALCILVGIGGLFLTPRLPTLVLASLSLPLLASAVGGLLLRAGAVSLAARLVVSTLWVIITFFTYGSGGIHSPILVAYFSTTVMAGSVTGRRGSVIFAGCSAAMFGLFMWLDTQGIGKQPLLTFSPLFVSLIQISAVIFTGFLVYDIFRVLDIGNLRLRQNEVALRELVQSAPEGIVALDGLGAIVNLNPAAERALGPQAQVGTRFAQLQWRDREAIERLFDAGDVSGRGLVGELQLPGGEHRELELLVRPLAANTASAFRISIRDITDRRNAERERDRLTDQLHQAQRLESLGLLAGGVAHDFNNITTIVLANAEVLLEGPRDAETAEALTEIVNAARRAGELSHQLLAFGRKQVLNPRILRLSDVVNEVVPMLRRLLAATIDVEVNADQDAWVRADHGGLVQLLVNLGVNARDAMPSGGRLSIVVATNEAHCQIVVGDTGEGMDEATLKRIFEPFFTTKVVGKGTGLGLSVVQAITSQSGGTVHVKSTPKEGTAFTVSLPRVPAPVQRIAPPALQTKRERKRATILLVEDESAVRRLAQRILEGAGHEVLSASDGLEGQALAASCDGVIDILIADIVMPRSGGVELAHTLAPLRPQMHIVLMSGYAADAFGPGRMLSKGFRFLPKPFGPAELLAIVDDVQSKG